MRLGVETFRCWGVKWRVAAHQKPVFGPILGGFRAPKRFLVQSSAGFGLQIGFWPNSRRVLGFKTIFGPILGGFWAPNRFLVQFPAGFGLQIDFWPNPRRVSRRPCRGGLCRGREVWPGTRVGAYCIRPTDVPTGTGAGHIYSALRGPSNGGECNSPLHRCHKTRVAAHLNSVFSPKRGSPRT